MSRNEDFGKHGDPRLMLPGGTKKRKLYLESPQQDRRGCDPGQLSRPPQRVRTGGDGRDAESALTRHKPIQTIDWRAELCRVLGAGPSVSNEDILDKLNAAFDELEEARRLQRALKDGHHAPPRYQVIYRIRCGIFGGGAYEKPPWIVRSGPHDAHLRGSSPISNLELHLERNKDIAFIVYADFECCKETPTGLGIWRRNQYHPVDADVLSLLTQESVAIVSEKMLAALRALADSALRGILYPTFTVSSSNGFLFPYLWWFHRREEIYETIASLDDEPQLYLSLMQGYIRDRLESEWRKVDELTSKHLITAEYLEYIYAPRQVLVSKLHGSSVAQLEGYQTTSWLRRPTHWDFDNPSIDVESWSFDGSFKRVRKHLLIPPPRFTGEFDITSLAFYPQKFASDEIIAALLKRGKMFWKCRRRNYVFHPEVKGDGTQNSLDSRFMVDMETYKHMHPQERDRAAIPDGNVIDTIAPEVIDQDEPRLDDSFFMCLPTRTVGFNMQKKEWVNLEVHFLEDVQWNTQAFDYLVINPVTKELIKAVVMNQLSGQANADLIRGKGNGLFMLLHGGPGTGKTLTAESVAEIAKKPLYRVTCGDIGTKAEDVERYLEIVLHLGKTWGCVVLLDEADVFLEQRSLLNLERNALVSVFLRVLEYYDGILILTSNRVGIFDEAFKSRIQLSLRYNNLGQEERRQIWKNFLLHLDKFQKSVLAKPTSESQMESLIGHGIDISDLDVHVEDLSQADLNGREIRNALSTARQLALYRGQPLQYRHLKDVMNEAKKFDEYLKELHEGYSADDILRDRQER